MYATILVPVDGSETSNNGLAEAIKIAKSQGSKICLIHIVNEFVFDYSFNAAMYSTDVVDSLRERGKSIIAEAAARVKQEGLAVVTVLLESIGGPAADLIVAKADELHADLIVMGTHGRRGLRRLALGSDAEQVLRMANVPVLMVKGSPASVVPKRAVA
jgi:nucleotide-binding universal stress UspA family protein